jgi:hypothetical protein
MKTTTIALIVAGVAIVGGGLYLLNKRSAASVKATAPPSISNVAGSLAQSGINVTEDIVVGTITAPVDVAKKVWKKFF